VLKYFSAIILSFFIFTSNIQAESLEAEKVKDVRAQRYINDILDLYEQGKYKTTIIELNNFDQYLTKSNLLTPRLKGLLSFWKASAYKKLNEFPQALDHFRKAIFYKFEADELYYEYAQTLYTSEQNDKAIAAFRMSARNNYKKAVSLYYVGYLYQEKKDYKRALKAYRLIEELKDDPERANVLQAAQMQIGDIYYELARTRKHPVEAMETYVVPQYKKALNIDPESKLAEKIKTKIIEIQRVFELVLFKLRNGRPTVNPPYFVRLMQSITNDSNVIFSPDETVNNIPTTSSMISRTEMMARYTKYYKNIMSYAPEARSSYTRHFERNVDTIRANDNYGINAAIRTAYETSYNEKPASWLFDLEYGYVGRDVKSDGNLVFNSRSTSYMFGRRFNPFSAGETIMRYRLRDTINQNASVSSKTHSVTYEQIVSMSGGHTLLLFNSLDLLRAQDSNNDSNALVMRVDYIMPRVKNFATPTFGLMGIFTDTMKQSATRGTEVMLSPSMRLTRTIFKKYRLNLKYEYMQNSSNDKNFQFKKHVYGFDLEYLF